MSKIISREFGLTKNGEKVTAYELLNGNNVCITILDFGGTIQSLTMPDKNGVVTDIVLGYDDVASYEKGTCYYGAIIGRCANRIDDGRFVLDGKKYALVKNEEFNHVHGVFHQRMFKASVDGDALVLRYFSPDMEEGYPGNFNTEVRYTLHEDNSLEITYEATTDAPTLCNLTNHSYFNLNGQDGSTILDHKLQLNSSYFTEYTDTFAQTGNIIAVENTPFDFREEHVIGERFYDDYRQLRICTGYDHNMILDGDPTAFKPIGTLKSDKTGIVLEAFTTEPATQFYSGNYMIYDTVPFGKNGVHYPKNGGICLEAQHYPDSINHANFPSTVLRPGETYRQRTIYKFTIDK